LAVSFKTPPPRRGTIVHMTSDTTPAITMQFGWTIVYVDDPTAAAAFYERTFGLPAQFAAPDGSYAQLDTGATKLAFASYALGEQNFPGGVRRAESTGQPANVEIALITKDVDAGYAKALAAGCTSLSEPDDKPHGQRVAWVRDPFGTLIELATPL
jgi:uncharacterized glyoxalase superfamily protein PhnB